MKERSRMNGAEVVNASACFFSVWAPERERVELVLKEESERVVAMTRNDWGYYQCLAEQVGPGARYKYRIDGVDLPDPASRFQPEGVHGPSEVMGDNFPWTDQGWFGVPLSDYVLYELHVGTFTPEGTFEAVIPHLARLKELGITAIELMPVAQFPGDRNWGYDGVFPYAVQNSYGGPMGLKRLVNAAHQVGLAVVLDVVYNHLGPEGNYLGQFAPYFTERYRTGWGPALNFDGPFSDEVRRYFVENALYWQTEFHMDALRLDAVHAIFDTAAVKFLEDLAEATGQQSERLNRRFYLIAESDLNDARLLLPRAVGGYGLHAQWSDDFHHALHVLLTGETYGYYQDFGGTGLLADTLREGYGYINKYSTHRRRRHGNSPKLAGTRQFVVYSSNHDQVGNRAAGERLSHLVSFQHLKLAAASVVLSPFIPMLFMGEEYGETAPFQYFTSHTDPDLAEAVRRGRREEFKEFHAEREVPDPQEPATFQRSKLDHGLRGKRENQVLQSFYQELLRLRQTLEPIRFAVKERVHVSEIPEAKTIAVQYHSATGAEAVYVVLCFQEKPTEVKLSLPAGRWCVVLNSADQRWEGPGHQIPEEVESAGLVQWELPATACLVLKQKTEGE